MKYRIVGGFSFYERAEIKDMISYLTVALNPEDSVNVMRIINVPVRGIGKTTTDPLADLAVERETSMWGAIEIVVKEQRLPGRTLRGLEAFHKLITDFVGAAQELSTAELLERIVNSSKYVEMLQEEGTEESESRIENIRELLTAAVESDERGESLRDFLDHAALVSDQDAYDEAAPITLMTLHTAKGLEFPVVFITGSGRRLVSTQPVHGGRPSTGGRTKVVLCRHDARRAEALSDVCAVSALFRKYGSAGVGAVAVPVGDTRGSHRGSRGPSAQACLGV